MNGKIFALVLFMLVIVSGGMLVSRASQTQFKLPSFDLKSLIPVKPSPIIIPSANPIEIPTSSSKPIQKASPRPTPRPTAKTQVGECYRFKITHLDGSTSNLCYTYNDQQQLTSLSWQLSSAKTFYEFHLDGAADYQKQYEQTGSSIYLDAKKRQEELAAQEKAKMDSINAQMYNLEQRGYK